LGSLTKTIKLQTGDSPRRGCLFHIRRGLKWFGIILVALVVLGVAYQTVATALDKGAYAPRGQLYNVNGHQIHMVCMGQGSPAVILQAGLSAESLWWHRIQTVLSQHTRVCAYDRPGLGWSEPTSGPRDALTIVGELHALLGQAGISTPYVMAGHSYGAIWTRIYAAKYPREVAGIVLVDSGLVIPQQFASQGEYDQWKTSNDAVQALVWATSRLGIVRLTGTGDFTSWGYLPEIVPELVALRSSNQVFDTTYAEQIPVMRALTEASASAKNLGNLPMVVLWASETATMMEHIPALNALHDELATYSSNSLTRTIAGSSHGSILANEQHARQVSDSILEVIEAARTGKALKSSGQ
jgi:pimeloyl-ACP methyl ester carboxylesterase